MSALVKPYDPDDTQTEIAANRRLRRLERRREIKEQYTSKNGEVVKYLPTDQGFLVTSAGEVLAELRLA